MRESLLTELLQREAHIAYRVPPPDGKPPFAYQPGRLPILISAPHAAAHTRQGRLKAEEEFTAALASCVAARSGAHTLFATHQALEDPNFDRHSRYKRRLARLVEQAQIEFVLDLHGMSNRHGMGLALGTINGRSCSVERELLLQALSASGFTRVMSEQHGRLGGLGLRQVVVEHPRFTGGRTSATITRFVSSELGVAAAQLEIASSARIVYRGANGRWGPFWGDPHTIQNLVSALTTFVRKRGPGRRQSP